MEPQNRSKVVSSVVGITLASLVVFGIALSVIAMLAARKPPALKANGPPPPITAANRPIPLETWVIHGKGALPETHVPFRLSPGKEILVKAHINGKPIECMVDTGCSDILWDSKLALTNQRTGLQSSAYDAGSHVVALKEAILDRVQIGGLELRQMPSNAVVSAASQMNSVPILGNSAFAHTVLTVDYARKELVIRPSSPKDKLLSELPGDHVLNFQWGSPNARGRSGSPCVRGNVISLPATFMVDTGWCGNVLGLGHTFYSQVLPMLEKNRNKTGQASGKWAFGKSSVITISQIPWSFDGTKATTPAIVVGNLGPKAQAVFGYDILRHFKTTIDYPHRKILFQPN